jgi:hypothetical protein
MADIKFKSALSAQGGLKLPSQSTETVLTIDSSGEVVAGSASTTELGYLSGVTSSIQTQIGNKIDSSEKGANNGVATLDAGGKVPSSQLPNSVMEYLGNYNATTNSPALIDGTGNNGDVYRVSVAGTQDFGSGNITFAVGDFVIYNGTIWEKSVNSNEVVSVNGATGVVVLDTDDISEGTALYFTNERAQDAVGTILTDTATIDFTYNDGANTISAAVLPAGVDHNSLLNYAPNEHVDHSAVNINAASDGGLTGGGDITATRNLSVDINNAVAETNADDADLLLIYDDSAALLKKMSRGDFLAGIAAGSAGDISETSFSAANNQGSAANVTGLAFANGVVRSFVAQISVTIDATADLFEVFELKGIQKASSWDMSISSTGDTSGLDFTITTAGQIQYTSTNLAGFVSNTVKFRALTTSL